MIDLVLKHRRPVGSAQASALPAPPQEKTVWSTEALVLAVVALLVALANLPFWRATLEGRLFLDINTWRFLLTSIVILLGLHAVPVLLLATRVTVRPLLALLIVSSLVAQHMMQQYGVVLDPSMLRNALKTDTHEASELMTASLFINIGIGIAASALLWRVPLRSIPWRKALLVRALSVAGVLLVTVAALLLGFQDFSSTMRNQKEVRYTITPGNVLYSTARAVSADIQDARRVVEPLAPIHMAAGATAAGRKPRLLVVMVGETARSMNFSLNGYERTTNPELSALPIINFPQTTSCGTSTEVSLPCMFSSYGRANYDEARIRGSESLIQLLARSGMRVVWLDNQSGCKGVCTGVEFHDVTAGTDPALCPDGHCFDGALVQGLQRVIEQDSTSNAAGRDTVVVLHQLGNHGPAYSKRYPAEFARFKPECNKLELRDCSREEITNAYDNAILYTDHLLASTITLLQKQQNKFDVGLVYASDHGESLGEKGLYLHGMPLAIAPKEQYTVPMVWWFGGTGASGWNGLDASCLRARAQQPAHHDHLYHSIMGLMGVETSNYIAERDLISRCREPRTGV
ncbi:phosphoethanolamine transferase [Variovorax sp. HJSM1_2]|uniref:phosphoethanolamine transferase n=1 Tax=Variovorax sp. HJSM1_2 TaxID=3366263 RepID=UPI003BBC16F3